MRRKLYYFANKYLTGSTIKTILIIIVTITFLILGIVQLQYDWIQLLDLGILISFALVFICEGAAKLLRNLIEKYCEDEAKLNIDYNELVKKYTSENLICAIDDSNIKFPVIKLCDVYDGKIEINDDSQKFYSLPKRIACESKNIMKLTKHSITYNQINIRLDNLKVTDDGKVILDTSRTYYFDSLITNRASDYKMDNGSTIREIYEPGPYIKPLVISKFSNHLGFNGFVLTTDNKIPFIYRSDKVSIGKNTWGNSIGASLKTKYAVEKDSAHNFTLEGIGNSILREIEDELGIDCSSITSLEAVKNIITFYRDLVETGKPQFLFFLKVPYTSNELEKAFLEKNKKKKTGKEKVEQDGKIIEFFTIDELKKMKIQPGKLLITKEGKEKEYITMPSASASIVMLIEKINYDNEQNRNY